jgi:pimeloyl-ACP methyl ester carboxylesterase
MATSSRVRVLILLFACVTAIVWATIASDVGTFPGLFPTADRTTTLPATSAPATTSAPTTTLPVTTAAPQLLPFTRLEGFTTVNAYDPPAEGFSLWQQMVPRIEDIRFVSTADGTEQPALWLPPLVQTPAPLLVVVHSWSLGYFQWSSAPYAAWADLNGWAMIAPDFRGPNSRPETTGSDLAVQDVVDAIDFAMAHGEIDENRVFVIGYSGGGMMSLLLAGRHPDRISGAVSWVPVYDLIDWYVYVRDNNVGDYGEEIVSSCGGDPSVPGPAQDSCIARSPMTHLQAAADADLPIYIGHGLSDVTVPPDYAVRAFDQLVEPADRLGAEFAGAVREHTIPENVLTAQGTPTYFEGEDPVVWFARTSGPITVVLFDGRHDMVYHPGLAWIYDIATGP